MFFVLVFWLWNFWALAVIQIAGGLTSIARHVIAVQTKMCRRFFTLRNTWWNSDSSFFFFFSCYILKIRRPKSCVCVCVTSCIPKFFFYFFRLDFLICFRIIPAVWGLRRIPDSRSKFSLSENISVYSKQVGLFDFSYLLFWFDLL
jgi:hypothetical protein